MFRLTGKIVFGNSTGKRQENSWVNNKFVISIYAKHKTMHHSKELQRIAVPLTFYVFDIVSENKKPSF